MPNPLPSLLLLPLLLLAATAGAQSSEAALPPSQASAIERERAGLEQAGLDDGLRREAEAALATADAAERTAQERIETVRRLREAAETGARERAALQSRLAEEPTRAFREWERRLPDSPDPEHFEPLLAAERSELLRLRAELGQVASALAALAPPSAEGGGQEAELRLTIDDLERRLSAAVQASELAPALAAARRVRLRAELRAASAELLRLAVERDTAAQRREHLLLRQRVLQRELADREQRAALLQRKIAERTDSRLAELVAQMEAVVEEHEAGHPLRLQAEQSLQLAQELQSRHQALGRLRIELRGLESERDRVSAALRDTRTRLDIDSDGDALGLILLAERRQLSVPDALARRLAQLRSDLARTRLRQIDLAQQRGRDEVPAACQVPGRIEEGDDAGGEPEQAGARLALAEAQLALRTACSELVPRLDTVLQRHVETLQQAETTLHTLWTDTVELRELLDRRLFWMPSHGPVDLAWLRQVPAGWADLLKPSRFVTSGRLLAARLADTPWLSGAGLLLVIVLLRLRMSARRQLAALAPPLRQVAGDSYRLTARALLQTVLAALPWALLVWLLGYSLRNAGAAGKYSDSLGRAFVALAGGILLLDLLRWLTVERGLAHLHFRWTRARRESLQRALPWFALALLPALFLATLAQVRGVDLAIDTAGRTSLLLFAALSAGLLWRLLAPGQLWSPRGGAPEPQRQRQLLRIGLPGLLVAIALGLLGGYVYSGWILMICLWQTLWAVLVIALVHGMLARWFLLGERRLAWQRLQAQREAERSEEAAAEGDDAAVEVAAPELTLETVNAQTGRLLRALTLSLWLTALFFIWADVLPALGRLDEIALWSYSTLAEDGSSVTEFVSLRSVLFGIVVLALTFIAAGNLPGLLEIGLLSRISIDASTRYAISAVSRYLIVIAGSMIGLGLLGLRWSQLQWMAAALSVGLGFGLQEIFANFVSGLILLFERPFRVGDVITIGDYTGTVSRVRTRATTLIDFDNKEIVVPNKTFITERLINWTLSDSRTRLILKIGVAYGSNVAQTHALLLQAAAEHPQVLAEPPPRSWFLAFGDSSLDFELRVFVETLADRMPVTSELHGRIVELFDQAGIEIAFPQLDLHVRDVPDPRGSREPGEPPATVPGT
jgi:potassium-dependent mechanosensitive channel